MSITTDATLNQVQGKCQNSKLQLKTQNYQYDLSLRARRAWQSPEKVDVRCCSIYATRPLRSQRHTVRLYDLSFELR